MAYIVSTNLIRDSGRTCFQIQDTHTYEHNIELKEMFNVYVSEFPQARQTSSPYLRMFHAEYGLTSRFQQLQISNVFTSSIHSICPYTTLSINAKTVIYCQV
jgi:hypothetical protein